MDDYSYVPHLSRRTSRLRAAGESRAALRGRGYDRPYHGLRRPAGIGADEPGLRIADAIGLMTGGCVLTGWAARWIQRQAYCDGTAFGAALPVMILCGPGSDLRARPGIRPSDRLWLPGETVDLGGLVATTMARAAYDDMLDAPNPTEALVAVEMAVSTVIPQSRTALSNVRAVFGSHVKTRGRVQTRWALSHACTRSASPLETRTRMLAIDATGLERWMVNVPVFDRSEQLIGIPDLLDPATGLVLESDGAGHREEERHNDDNEREEDFERHGMTVVRVGAKQHARERRTRTDRRIRAGLEAATGAERRRWTTDKPAWWWDWPPGRRWD